VLIGGVFWALSSSGPEVAAPPEKVAAAAPAQPAHDAARVDIAPDAGIDRGRPDLTIFRPPARKKKMRRAPRRRPPVKTRPKKKDEPQRYESL